jgi:hypothetical protein
MGVGPVGIGEDIWRRGTESEWVDDWREKRERRAGVMAG